MWNCHLIAALLLCAALFGPSGASLRNTQPKEAEQADAKKLKGEQEELKARDLKMLQGKWVVIREVLCNTVQEGDRGSWVFKGDTVKKNNDPEGSFTIDTSTRPKRLIHNFTDREGQRRTMGYIYVFDDDQLMLMSRFIFNEDKPPFDFSNSDHFYRLKRADD